LKGGMNMPYEIYAKGMIIDRYIGHPETMRFDLVDNQIIVVMSRENIERYPLGGSFEFRFEAVYNTIFLLMKYGNCPWLSAPYSPHLSVDFEAVAFDEGEGMALSIIQICNDDGKIYHMSLLGLTTDFSNLLYCTADILYQAIPFDLDEHRKLITAVYNKMTDEELAEHCDQECRCIID